MNEKQSQYRSWLEGMRSRTEIPKPHRTPSNIPAGRTESGADLEPSTGQWVLTSEDPNSPAAEPYRLLAARLEGARVKNDVRKIAITSTMPGEGKTATALNVSHVLAKDSGRRVLLIDGDLKKSSVWRYTGAKPRLGLTDILADGLAPENVIFSFRHEFCSVLEAGLSQVNSSRLWKSPVIRDFIETMSRSYDYVIVDTPPVMAVVDTVLITELVDAIVVVVRVETTPKASFIKAVNSLPKSKILGTVLNGVPMTHRPYHYRYP
jgi:capsular exopolysaccharide synthesis family protein